MIVELIEKGILNVSFSGSKDLSLIADGEKIVSVEDGVGLPIGTEIHFNILKNKMEIEIIESH